MAADTPPSNDLPANRTPGYRKGMDIALRLLSQRAYSKRDIGRRLLLKEISPEDAAQVIVALLDYGYLNDEKLVAAYIAEATRRGRGPQWVVQKARLKGIEADTRAIREQMDTQDPEAELESARSAIQRKKFKVKESSGKTRRPSVEMQLRMKMSMFLRQRGFSREVIDQVVQETLHHSDSQQSDSQAE